MGEEVESVLQALQDRLDQLPKAAWSFVAALAAAKGLVPSPLSETLLSMVSVQHGVEIGPVHEALVSVIVLHDSENPEDITLRDRNKALIVACGAGKAAYAAIKFFVALPGLLVHTSCP